MKICDIYFSKKAEISALAAASFAGKGGIPGQLRAITGLNPVTRLEKALCIYGTNKKIRAQKGPETVDAPGFQPSASIVSI